MDPITELRLKLLRENPNLSIQEIEAKIAETFPDDIGLEQTEDAIEQSKKFFLQNFNIDYNTVNPLFEENDFLGSKEEFIESKITYQRTKAAPGTQSYGEKRAVILREQGTPEQIEQYPDLFDEKGMLKDYNAISPILSNIKTRTKEIVDTPEYKNSKDAFFEFEKQLAQKQKQAQVKLFEQGNEIQNKAAQLNSVFQARFGVGISGIKNYTFRDQAEVDEANNLIKEYGALIEDQAKFQASQKEIATFYSLRDNKNIRAEYTDGFEGVINSWKTGKKTSEIGLELLKLELGITDTTDEKELAEAYKKIAAKTAQKQGLLTSETFAKYNNAKSAAEAFDIFTESGGNVLEIGAALFAGSISQLLGAGKYIIPTTTIGGAGIGATAGAPVGGLGAIPGAIIGGLRGLGVGQALTNAVNEYTNSILDAGTLKYDLTDVDQVSQMMQDEEVWEKGREIGLKRGLTIGFVDGIQSIIVPKLYNPLSGTFRKTATVAAGALVVDPGFEALGEFGAQVISGQGIEGKEILSEAIGGGFGKTPNMALTIAYKNSAAYKQKIANKLSSLDYTLAENISGERIKTFAQNMLKLGRIDQAQFDKIALNAGVKIKVDNTVESRNNKQLKARVADLYSTLGVLEKAGVGPDKTNSIDQINQELAEIKQTQKLKTENTFTTIKDYKALQNDSLEAGIQFLKKLGLKEDIELVILDDITNPTNLPQELEGNRKSIISSLAGRNVSASITPYKAGEKQYILVAQENINKNALESVVDQNFSASAVSVAHEVLHAVLDRTFNNDKLIELGDQLNQYIQDQKGKGISEGVVNSINQRLNNIYAKDRDAVLNDPTKTKKQKQKAKAIYAQEVFTTLSDEIAQKNISWERQDRTFWQGISDKINDYFKYTLGMSSTEINAANITTGEAAFNFIKNYNRSFYAKRPKVKIADAIAPRVDATTSEELRKTEVGPSREDLKKTFDKFVQDENGNKKYNTLSDFQASEDYLKVYEQITAGKVMQKSILGYVLKDKSLQSLKPEIQNQIIQEVQDEVSFRFVKNFDPAKNESLFGYLYGKTPIVQKALLDVKKKYAKKEKGVSIDAPTVTGRQFEIEAEDVNIEETIDRNITQEQQTKESILKTKLTVTKENFVTQEIKNAVEAAVLETFEGNLPDFGSKDLRKYLTDTYKKKLFKPLKNALGKSKAYTEFLLENKQALLENLPLSYWVQVERVLPDNQKIFTKFVKRLTTQAEIDKYTELGRVYTENDADGPVLYQLLMPTDAQFIAFFRGAFDGKKMQDILGYTTAASTLGTRKDELARNIGVQLAFDMTPGVTKEKGLSETDRAKIALRVQRDINLRFSELGKRVKLVDTKKLVQLLEEGESTQVIANNLGVTKEYIDTIKTVLELEFPQNLGKRLGQDQIQYLNNEGFDKVSEEAGLLLVAGGFNVSLRNDKGLTANGTKYVNSLVDFANNFVNNAENNSAKIDRFIEFIRFAGRNVRAQGKVFKTNQEAWDNVYSKIINKNPEFKNLFRIEKGRIYVGDAQITTIKDPTNKKFRVNAQQYLTEFDLQSELAQAYFLDQVDYFKSLGDISMAKAFLAAEISDMRTSLKLLGKVTYIQKGNFDNLVYEHISPASYLARLTMSYLISDKLVTREQLVSELNKSKIALISKSLDKKVNKEKKTTISFNYSLAQDPEIRYEESGIDVQNDLINLRKSELPVGEFNQLIADATGIDVNTEISDVKAAKLGKRKGVFKFIIPPSADDFMGLMYYLVGKSEKGDKDLAFIKDNLVMPFSRGIMKLDIAKQQAIASFREIKKLIRKTPSDLNKKNETGFTNEEAVRVYIWDSLGYKVPGITAQEQTELAELVMNNPKLLGFAQNIKGITVLNLPQPEKGWEGSSLTIDIIDYINTTARQEYLKEFIEAKKEFFTPAVLNKLEAKFGKNYRDALEDMLYRMENGRHRPMGSNKLTNQLMNWINNSVGAIMFFNTRSALLQQLSLVNFINFSDNNPLAVAKTIGNQKQFWKDYSMLMNSDFLKQRRSGLKTDVNADEIAKAAEGSKNPMAAAFRNLLKAGFLPTQIADSHAIATGGASFYRNRLNRYLAEGMEQVQAEEQAFLDFQEIAEETQQSSRPDRISMQQASPLGRIILAFANTPMQYARLSKKAALDLINKRGDWKTNMSKLMYYTTIQNIIFSGLQSAAFAMMFDDETEEEEKNRYYRIANSTADSLLRGLGFGGAAVAAGKNMILEAINQAQSKRPDYEKAALKALSLSPPIDSKMRKFLAAGRAFTYKQTLKKMRTEGFSLENPVFEATGQIISAATNLPADRVIRKLDNLSTPVRQDVETWQAISLALGYSKWDVGLIEKSTPKTKPPYTGLKQVKRKKIKRKKLK